MALEQIKLDNLTWAEMVTAIRRRIPAASGGDWTLHAPVDPGVTLLELFAYLLEQRVYWLDQIPDSLVHAALSLMGETVKPAAPAATVLRFSALAFEKLNGLTQVRLVRSVPPLVFSTDEDVLLLPVDESAPGRYRIGLYTGKTDRTLDLAHERPICLMPAAAPAGEVRIVLWLTRQAPAAAPDSFGDYFSLLFELEVPSKIRPQWLALVPAALAEEDAPPPTGEEVPTTAPPLTAEHVPPPATLSWWYPSQDGGKLKPFPADAVKDGTRGLRRSGIVRLKLPPDWQGEFDPTPPPPGRWSYSLTLRIEDATFTSPPVLRRLAPNVVIARHRRQTKKHSLKANWLPLPDNKLALSKLDTASIQDHPALEDSVELSMKERDGEFDWEPAQTFTFRGPGDRVFTVDREKGLLRFGDGLTGRVPVVKRGVQNLTLSYFVGGGEQGNIGSDLSFEGLADIDLKATNLVPAEGGAEPESLEAARRRAAAALRRVDRAVTGLDHQTVVLSTPGVAFYRAYAALGHHPAHPCRIVPGAITVYVVPEAHRSDEPNYDQDCAYVAAPKPDQGALQAAREFIEKARLIGSEVFVKPVEYRAVSLAVVALGDPADPRGLNERVRLGLRKFLDPLRGGTQKKGWPFGEPLRPSVLLSEAQRAAGPDASIISVAIGLDGNEPSENCRDVEIEPHQLVVLCEVVVRLQADVTSQGGLR